MLYLKKWQFREHVFLFQLTLTINVTPITITLCILRKKINEECLKSYKVMLKVILSFGSLFSPKHFKCEELIFFQLKQQQFTFFLKVTTATKRYLVKLCHQGHRLTVFLFRRKVMFRSQDIQVFIFLTIPWLAKSVTWWVVVPETRYIFEYIFWTTTH